MARLVWTEPALQDLDAIADYISLDKPAAARRLVQRVFERVTQLLSHPHSGSAPSQLKGSAYRQLVIPPLRVFYRAEKTAIYIGYVMRGERRFCPSDLQDREKA